MDFLIVPTVGFKLLFVLVILRHQRRRLISFSVTANPTAEWIARQGVDQSVIGSRRGLDTRDPGREVPRIPGEIRRLIREMSLANPL